MTVLALVLGASLFFVGCETEVPGPGYPVPDADGIYYPIEVEDEDTLLDTLASGVTDAIAFKGNGDAFDAGKLVISAGQTVGFFSTVELDVGGLELGGTVYVENGGSLEAADTKEITVLDTGVLNVKVGGSLVTDVAESVVESDGTTVALGTGLVNIAGELHIGVATKTAAEAALTYVPTKTSAWLVLNSSAQASEYNGLAVPDGKRVRIVADVDEGGATLTVSTGVQMLIPTAAKTSTALATLTVEAGGSLYYPGTSVGVSTGMSIVVEAGATAYLGTVAKLKDPASGTSSVAAGGRLIVMAISDMNSKTIAVASNGMVNGIVFPDDDDDYVVSGITGGAVTVANPVVPSGGWTLTGPLVVAADNALTLTGDLTLGTTAIAGLPGVAGLYLQSGSVALATVGGGTKGAETAGNGKIVAADTEIAGVWQAYESTTTGYKVTIALDGNQAATITASNVAAVLTAKALGATITQKAKSSAGSNLTVADDTVIDFGVAASGGSLVLKKATAVAGTEALIVLGSSTGTTTKLVFGTGATAGAPTVTQLNAALAGKAVAGNSVTAESVSDNAASGLRGIIGEASANTITGPASTATADTTIDSTLQVAAGTA
jgi:hypothetical protein